MSLYRYIIMLWLKEPHKDALSEACQVLRTLAYHIAGLYAMEVEPVEDSSHTTCHLCMTLLFMDKASLERYKAHPIHETIEKQIGALRDHAFEASYPLMQPPRAMPRLYACVGPSNRDRETLGRLMDVGMTGIRISLTHQTVQEALPVSQALYAEARARDLPADVLLDPCPGVDVIESIRLLGATGLIFSIHENEAALKALKAQFGPSLRLYGKVDCLEDLDALPGILTYADEIVLARGGLVRNLPRFRVAQAQKQVASICLAARKPFMIATDLLTSMRRHLVPTASELCDIHNAIADGAASLMLNQETAIGLYPIEAMETLRRAAQAAIAI